MYQSLFDLSQQVALISGASRGIGEEAAKCLAEYGARVIVSSRKIDDCERVAEEIRVSGGDAQAIACNIGDMTQIFELMAHIKSDYGRLDICINNAATNPYFGHVLDTDLGAFQKTVDVNIRGYFFMSVEAGKMMRDQGKGVIVNTASINAIQPGPMQGIYSITKAAVVNMTKTFAKECGPLGIRCNALLPGLTKTKFAGALFSNDDIYQMSIEKIPMQRHAEPSEMAGTLLYLCSNASSYTNGECIVVDGGLLT